LSGATVSCSTAATFSDPESISAMANQVSDYHRGEMDIHEQAATYQRVMAMTKYGSLVVGTLVLFLTLWFCTGTGFMGAAITAVVMIALGVFFLRGSAEH
jgi:hypothetical protein